MRHGENVANLSRTFSHRIFDGDLTARGRQQALELADTLVKEGTSFTALWCSPLKRARQTAEVLADALRMNITGEMDELRELRVGDLDGRNDSKAWTAYDWVLDGWRRGDLDRRFPGGENAHELVARLHGALVSTAAAASEPVLIVAHGGNIRSALPTLTGAPDPGRDLATGAAAEFHVARDGDTQLLHWPPI